VLVYGDHVETISVAAGLARASGTVEALAVQPPGLARHQVLVEEFIAFASLVQALVDWKCAVRGHDEVSAMEAALLARLRRFGQAIDCSWRSGFREQAAPEFAFEFLDEMAVPESVTVKRSEGYAFYALYPETYLEAARTLPAGCIVIGLRSIGTGLAALVAAACGAETVFTVRPGGPPFARAVRAGPKLEARVRANLDRQFVIVDEGPGLSGSSFGGVADWLEGLGLVPERIAFMPSHAGDLGPEAAPAHRLRWARAEKRVCSFDALFTAADAPAPLHLWFRDITGDLAEPPLDLSGGGWAEGRAGIPTSPSREARKFLLRGSEGAFLLKFAGLDSAAQAKFGRARALYEAGFCAEPLAMRYGFILERWIDGAAADAVPVQPLIDYLAFRRDSFPAETPGASLAELLEMAAHNIREAAPDTAFGFAARWNEDRLRTLQAAVRPVHVDARLHRWEWLCGQGRILKTDALDHAQAHDLVGCQDILWDVAGAIAEHEAAAEAEGAFASAFTGGDPVRVELLVLMKLCYLAFQLGWWSFSGTAEGAAQAARYRHGIAPLLASLG
jgi:hypothetical protein